MSADEFRGSLSLLKHGEIDDQSLGLFKRIWKIPDWLAKLSAPIISKLIKSSLEKNMKKISWIFRILLVPYHW